MLERLVELAIRFLVGAWVIRYLGPGQFGVYSYALSFVALFTVIATLGLDQITVRDLARDPDSAGDVLATAFALRAWAAVITFGLVVGVTLLVEDDPVTRAAILIVAGQLFLHPANVLDLWFQSQVRSEFVVWTRSAVTLLVAAAQIACILAELPLQAFLVLVLVQSAMKGLGMYACFRIAGPVDVRWRYVSRLAAGMLRDAWPLLFAGLSISVYMRIDQVMLGMMVGVEAVGTYGAAVRVSEIWHFLPTALAVSVFPGIVQMRSGVPADVYHRRLQALYDGMALYSYAIILVMIAGAPLVVHLLFGTAYHDSVAILRVHIWALMFVSLGTVYSRWLVAEGLAVFSMVTTILGAVTNVALNIALIPSFEGLGAAWATVIAQAIAAYLSTLLFRPLRPMFIRLTKALAVPFRFRAIRLSLRPERKVE